MEVGTLGDIVFEAGTMNVLVPQNISADSRMRYEEHNVFGSYPVMEWLGPETPEISLDVRLSRQLMEREPDDVKIQLLSHMRRGDVLRLTLCGQNWGRVHRFIAQAEELVLDAQGEQRCHKAVKS